MSKDRLSLWRDNIKKRVEDLLFNSLLEDGEQWCRSGKSFSSPRHGNVQFVVKKSGLRVEVFVYNFSAIFGTLKYYPFSKNYSSLKKSLWAIRVRMHREKLAMFSKELERAEKEFTDE